MKNFASIVLTGKMKLKKSANSAFFFLYFKQKFNDPGMPVYRIKMTIAVPIFILLVFVGGCKPGGETNPVGQSRSSDSTSGIQNAGLMGLNDELLQKKIKEFYSDSFMSRDPNHRITKVTLLSSRKVSISDIDSMKLQIYRSGIANLENAISERDKLIDRLNQKSQNYTTKGLTDKGDEIKAGMEKYRKRNAIQIAELNAINERIRVVTDRSALFANERDSMVEVLFSIDAFLNAHSIRDTSSLIFDNQHNIEDMLKDGPWQPENQ